MCDVVLSNNIMRGLDVLSRGALSRCSRRLRHISQMPSSHNERELLLFVSMDDLIAKMKRLLFDSVPEKRIAGVCMFFQFIKNSVSWAKFKHEGALNALIQALDENVRFQIKFADKNELLGLSRI